MDEGGGSRSGRTMAKRDAGAFSLVLVLFLHQLFVPSDGFVNLPIPRGWGAHSTAHVHARRGMGLGMASSAHTPRGHLATPLAKSNEIEGSWGSGKVEAEQFAVEEPADNDWGGDMAEGDGSAWTPEAEEGRMRFEAYYTAQRIAAPDELARLFSSMTFVAPTTFRINTPCQLLEGLMEEIARLEAKGDVHALEAMPGLAWSVSRDAGAEVWRFLSQQQSRGALCRQELVSMLPPLLLLSPTLQEGRHRDEGCHIVLDMCAR